MSGTYEVQHLGEPVPCCWFALCPRLTDIAVEHPILGPTPVCLECAAHVGMELTFPNAVVHHLAFNKTSEAVPICGHTLTGDGLSLEANKVTCGLCRRICELGPPPPEEDDGIECPNCMPFDREDCDYPEGH